MKYSSDSIGMSHNSSGNGDGSRSSGSSSRTDDEAKDNYTYVKMYKPRNVLSSMIPHNGFLPAAFLLPQQLPYVYHVGRLDYESEGLLLWTNNPAFSRRLTSPKVGISKTYHVLIEDKNWPWRRTRFTEQALDLLITKGIAIGDEHRRGLAKFDPASSILDQTPCGRYWISVILREGRKREIRRVFDKLNFRVLLLRRVAIGEGPLAVSLWPSSDSSSNHMGYKITTAMEELNRLGGPELRNPDRRKNYPVPQLKPTVRFLLEQSPPQPDEALPVPPESSLASADSEKSASLKKVQDESGAVAFTCQECEGVSQVFPSTHPELRAGEVAFLSSGEVTALS